MEIASLPKTPAPPLALQIAALVKTDVAAVSKTSGTSDSPAPAAAEAVLADSLAPTLDRPAPPLLPSPFAPRSPNEDLAFAVRLLGRESPITPDSAAKISQAASGIPAAPTVIPKSVLPASPATSAIAVAKDIVTTAALPIPTGKEIAASAPRVPVHEPAPIEQLSAAKTRSATPTADSPKPTSKAPVRDEPKGNDTSDSGPDRETAPAAPPKTLEARSPVTPFADVHEFASTAAPEPVTSSQPKPLDTNTDALVPLKTSDAPAPIANNISLRLNGPDQTSATVRVLDRSGEIHVSVRASDPQLATTLRSDVDQLRSHLNTRGWDAEVWKPEGAPVARETSNHTNADSREHSGSAFKRDAHSQSQSRQQQDSHGRRPAWLDELDESVHQGGQ